MRFSYDAEESEIDKELAKVEAMRAIALQLERIADAMENDETN